MSTETPYTAGVSAGTVLQVLIDRRQDLATSLVEWYRGFCVGVRSARNPRAERLIALVAKGKDAAADTGFVAASQAAICLPVECTESLVDEYEHNAGPHEPKPPDRQHLQSILDGFPYTAGAKYSATFNPETNCLQCRHEWPIDKECAICEQPLGLFTPPDHWEPR